MNLIYHYTTIESFLKILEGSISEEDKSSPLKDLIFWATNIFSLNDSQELAYGFNMFCPEIIKEIEESNQIPDDEYKLSRLYEIIRGDRSKDRWNSYLMDLLHKSHFASYVISFSEKKDFLPMWNVYANKSLGVSLGFVRDDLETYKVEYGSIGGDADILYRATYEVFYRKVKESKSQEERVNFAIQYLSQSAVLGSVLIKHPAFKYENEVRKVITPTSDLEIKLRCNVNGKLIPYMEVKLPAALLKEIIVGPCSDFDNVKCELDFKLRSLGLNVNIVKSEIPYRNM